MPLSQTELVTLAIFLQGHPFLPFIPTLSQRESWMQLSGEIDFFDQSNDNDTFLMLNVMHSLSFSEKSALFNITTSSQFFSDVAALFATGQDVIVQSLGATDTERQAAVRLLYDSAIDTLVKLNIINLQVERLLLQLIGRDPTAFLGLVYLFVAANIILEPSVLRLQVELSSFPRWVALQLPSAPTQDEITSALSLPLS